jgi:hypothetical protein
MTTKKMPAGPAQWREHYARLQTCLAEPGWISEGYVQDRGPGAGGPCYQWTSTPASDTNRYNRLPFPMSFTRASSR